MRVLHSKHQKLVLQCYPPGKNVDKKPNSLELSYLLYYVSTRRVKLQKVIEFLKNKTRADVRSRRSGNLFVTLSIVAALIEKCDDNLNAFAPQVCSILSSILTVKELPLCKALVATYGTFCAKLDNGLFTGDKSFVDLFSSLTQEMIATGENQLASLSTNNREWKMFALLTCRSVFSCLGYNAQLSNHFIPQCVAILSNVVTKLFTYDKLSARLMANLNVESSTDRGLMRITTVKSAVQVKKMLENFEEDSLTDEDLGEEALYELRTLFNTTLLSQISEATLLVVEFGYNDMNKSQTSSNWSKAFLETCASYIPVQLRFETLLTLLNRLSQMSDKLAADNKIFPHVRHYAQCILDLVSADFNMIGLSISDILLQLLKLHKELHLRLSEHLSHEQVSDLGTIYSECICNLASHIYYYDQASDSLECVLMQIDSVLANIRPTQTNKAHDLVLQLLGITSKILKLLSVRSSVITWNPVTLESWDISLQLLAFEKAYPRFSALATQDQIRDIQREYLDVFQTFIKHELTGNNDADEKDGFGLPTQQLSSYPKAYNADPDNSLRRVLAHSSMYFEEKFYSPEVSDALTKVLESLCGAFGGNFVAFFIPFFDQWQREQAPASNAMIARDLCAYTVMRTCLTTLGAYKDAFETDLSEYPFEDLLQFDIDLRQKEGVWSNAKEEGKISNQFNSATLRKIIADSPLGHCLSTAKSSHQNLTDTLELNPGKQRKLLSASMQDSYAAEQDSKSGGYGLGLANDITNIYAGLIHTAKRDVTQDVANVSHITQDTLPTFSSQFHHELLCREPPVPSVRELKSSFAGANSPVPHTANFVTSENASVRSILQKEIHTTDLNSILDNLDFGDESRIVV